MLTLSLFRAFAIAALMIPWMLNLASRLLARSLNMPEPLVHSTGAFVLARVQAVESSFGERLCPIRLWRQIRGLAPPAHALTSSPVHQQRRTANDPSRLLRRPIQT